MDMLGADDAGVEGVLDIPERFVGVKSYRASLAHKANHSFAPNAKFVLFHHPRFGKVPALRSVWSCSQRLSSQIYICMCSEVCLQRVIFTHCFERFCVLVTYLNITPFA